MADIKKQTTPEDKQENDFVLYDPVDEEREAIVAANNQRVNSAKLNLANAQYAATQPVSGGYEEYINNIPTETPEQQKKREKRELNRRRYAAIGDGLIGLANIMGTANGAAPVQQTSLSEAEKKRQEVEMAKRLQNKELRAKYAAANEQSKYARQQAQQKRVDDAWKALYDADDAGRKNLLDYDKYRSDIDYKYDKLDQDKEIADNKLQNAKDVATINGKFGNQRATIAGKFGNKRAAITGKYGLKRAGLIARKDRRTGQVKYYTNDGKEVTEYLYNGQSPEEITFDQ